MLSKKNIEKTVRFSLQVYDNLGLELNLFTSMTVVYTKAQIALEMGTSVKAPSRQ